LGAKAEVTRLDSERDARAESQPHHRDTPPEDVYFVEAGLLARGSGLLSGLPKTFAGFSDFGGQRLAAYSCGGSSGFAASLLASEKFLPKNHDASTYRQRRARVNSAALSNFLGTADTPH
jgi:hypothetical protein